MRKLKDLSAQEPSIYQHTFLISNGASFVHVYTWTENRINDGYVAKTFTLDYVNNFKNHPSFKYRIKIVDNLFDR
jgi:hypothetical protein